MGLQAQIKTSLPWPSSMLTLLLGISSGPASAIAVSPPLACGLLQSGTASQYPARSAAPPLARPLSSGGSTSTELCVYAAGSYANFLAAQVCVTGPPSCRHGNTPASVANLQHALQIKHSGLHLLWGWLRCLSATSSFFACTLRFRSSTGFVMISRAESMVYSPSIPDASCSHPH